MKSLNAFKSSLGIDGVITTNRYDITINRSRALVIGADLATTLNNFDDSFDLVRTLQMRCETLNIPGIQIGTTEFKLHGGMPSLKIPNTRIYDEVQVTFLATKDLKDKYFFEEWLNDISDFTNNTIAYYNDVACDIVIDIYNESDEPMVAIDSDVIFDGGSSSSRTGSFLPPRKMELVPVYSIKLHKAIPSRIETFQMGWSETDSLLKYTVNFSYETLEFLEKSNRTVKKFQHLDKKFE